MDRMPDVQRISRATAIGSAAMRVGLVVGALLVSLNATAYAQICGDGTAEPGEQCDEGTQNGQLGSCCDALCMLLPNGAACRPAVDSCDLAETCKGTSPICPPTDDFQPAGTVCRAAADTCDVVETCKGTSPLCPGDGFLPASTVCRVAVDVCDVAENCKGTSALCPGDGFQPAGTVCRAAVDVCDVGETCKGTSGLCPGDGFQPASTVCRAATGVCDAAENCKGTSALCPGDGFLPASSVCRSAAGVCDSAEACSGSSANCPADALQASGTPCRAPKSSCDLTETCTGSSLTCPPDNGTPDSDGDTVCDAEDVCPDESDPQQADTDTDGLGDACDPCTLGGTVSKAKVKLGKFTTPVGDDALTLSGMLTFAAVPALDPVADGVRLLIEDAHLLPVVDVSVPGGAFDKVTKTGWKVNGAATTWTYSNPLPVGGVLNKVSLKKTKTVGQLKFTASGKQGSFATTSPTSPVTVTLVLDPPSAVTGLCGGTTFPGPKPIPACAFDKSGGTLTCK